MTTKLQQFCQELLPMIQAGAKGARIGCVTEPSGKPVEISIDGENDVIGFVFSRKYTIIRDMITVNGFEVVAGESVAPDHNATIFWPDFEAGTLVEGSFWSGSALDTMMFNRGLVYLNKQHAIARAKAMLGVDPYAKDEAEVQE